MVTGALPDGGFLLSQRQGYYLTAMDANGGVRWRAITGIGEVVGLTSDGSGGWYLAGLDHWRDPSEVGILRYDSSGFRRLRCLVPGYRYPPDVDPHTRSLWMAPDGTLRIVVNLKPSFFEPSPGVAVAAFSVDTPPELPRIVSLPAPVNWDGTNPVSFPVEIAEPNGSQIQWHSMAGPVPGATNRTLTLPADQVPFHRGYVYPEFASSSGVIAAPVTALRLGRVLVEALQADLSAYRFRVYADIDTRFRVEYSLDLSVWEPVEGWEGEYDLERLLYSLPSGGLFYRAVELP